ncbi:MAG: PstS family phosphate ABC transporter substrate-binding protein [Waterburya sp.]
MNDHHNQTIPCPYCTYESNSINATKCRICGTPLKPQSSTPSKIELRQEHQLDSSLSTPPEQSLPKQSLFANIISLDFLRFIILLTLSMIIIGGGIFLYQNRDVKSALTARQEEEKEAENTQSKLKLHSTLEQVTNVPQGLFWYGSSVPFAPLHTSKIKQVLAQAHPGFKIQYQEPPLYTEPGSANSMTMLLDGIVSFAELSRPVKDSEYVRARKRGIQLQQIPIASDGIVFFVHPSLPIDKLSTDQIRDLILGKITNWKQLNGPDLPVKPFVFNPQIAPSTLLLLFEQPELTQFGASTQFVRDYTDAIRKVNRTPGSFSYASAATIINQRSVRPLLLAKGSSQAYVNPFTKERKINSKALKDGSYPLVRRLFIIIRQDGTIDELAGLAYTNLLLSKQGQKLIEGAGFVPIR